MRQVRTSCRKGKKKNLRARGRDADKMSLYGQDENYDKNGSEYHDLCARTYARCKRLY